MRFLLGVAAGALLVGMSAAAMAETNGWYVGAEGGVNYMGKDKVDGGKAKFDLGPAFVGQVGYGFGAVRTEAELGWRTNGVDKIEGLKAKGDVSPLTLMGNVYYDIATGTPWTPYLGAGIGAAYLSADKVRLDNAAVDYRIDDSNTVFAYQGIAGVEYALNDNLSIKGDYRYLATTEGKFKTKGALSGGEKVKYDYESHAIMVGFTYKFGAPAKPAPVVAAVAAPAPAPAPAPKATQAPIAKSYLVFFDFDKSDITPEADRIIQQAATNAKSSAATSINLIGHTDAAGSEKYNQALSLRRANAVKAVLVKAGIPASEISVVGKGKSELLVPTKDGVREPQNRRVQIVLP